MSEALRIAHEGRVQVNYSLTGLLQKYSAANEPSQKLFQLNLENSAFDAAPHLTVAMQHSAHHSKLIEAPGLPELRDALRAYHATDAHQVLIGQNLSHLTHVLLQVFAGRLLLTRGSSNFVFAHAKSLGKEVAVVETKKNKCYKLDLKTLEEALSKNPDGQSILYLSNPTSVGGRVYSKSEVKALVALCRQYQCYIIENNSLDSKVHEHQIMASFSEAYPEGTISIRDLGKALCSPGSELAYALIPQELEVVLDAATLYMKATNATVSPVYQHAFARVMQKHSALQEYLDGINNIYQSCAYYTFKRAQELKLSPTLPVAGVSIQVDFSAYKEALFSIGIKTSDELAMFLLKNYRLSLSPGEQFSIPGTDLIMRISCTDFDGQRAFDGAEKVADLDRDYVERYCSRIVRGLDALEKFIESIR